MWLFLGDALLAFGSISSCGSRLPKVAFCYWGMQRFRLIPRHAILRHTPYMSGSSRCVCLCRQILAEMSSHILIFWGFITSLLDGIHVILGHIPYPPGSSGICLFVHTIVIERMSLVMTFLGFHHIFYRCHTRSYPLYFGIIWRWSVCSESSYRVYEPLL